MKHCHNTTGKKNWALSRKDTQDGSLIWVIVDINTFSKKHRGKTSIEIFNNFGSSFDEDWVADFKYHRRESSQFFQTKRWLCSLWHDAKNEFEDLSIEIRFSRRLSCLQCRYFHEKFRQWWKPSWLHRNDSSNSIILDTFYETLQNPKYGI